MVLENGTKRPELIEYTVELAGFTDASAIQIGINTFSYKPFTKSDFANTVREILDKEKA